ncbi:MAG: hypothetical protein AAF745_08830 [Planctomycetota bacterium]
MAARLLRYGIGCVLLGVLNQHNRYGRIIRFKRHSRAGYHIECDEDTKVDDRLIR